MVRKYELKHVPGNYYVVWDRSSQSYNFTYGERSASYALSPGAIRTLAIIINTMPLLLGIWINQPAVLCAYVLIGPLGMGMWDWAYCVDSREKEKQKPKYRTWREAHLAAQEFIAEMEEADAQCDDTNLLSA